MADDFKNRYFDLLDDSIKTVENKIDVNTRLTQKALGEVRGVNKQLEKTNGRVDKLWEKNFPEVVPKKELPSLLHDPAIRRIITYILGAIMLLLTAYLSTKGIDISKLP